MEILKLPDELLLMIFSSVSSNDLLSLARTCRKFADLTVDWRLVSTLNFRYETMLRCDLMKNFLSNSARTDQIITIDLSSCHWLSSTFLLNVLLRLRNIENVLVADTALSFAHLKRVLTSLNTVKRLSWSWKKGTHASDLKSLLQNLVFLYLCVHEETHMTEISSSSFLESLENLEELWVVCVPSLQEPPNMLLQKQFLHLKKIVVSYTKVLEVFSSTHTTHLWSPHSRSEKNGATRLEALLVRTGDAALEHSCGNTNTLKKLSIIKPINFSKLREILQQTSSLTVLHVSLLGDFSILFLDSSKLEELCLNGIITSESGINQEYCSTNYCESVSLCPLLRRLRLPKGALVCSFSEFSKIQSKSKHFSQKAVFKSGHTVTPFVNMVQSTPLLEEFELGTESWCDDERHATPHKPDTLLWDFNALSSIADWKKLTSLTLANLFVMDGKFFEPILLGCKSLKSLKVLNLGLRGKCNYANDLYSALKHSNSLIDFEWEQANVGKTLRLWESLSELKSIRRLSIRNSGFSDMHESNVMHFLEKCPSVTFLFLLTGATQTRCNKLMKNVNERWSKERPAFIVQILSSSLANWRQKLNYIPAIHLGEMWTLKSRLANVPSCSSSFLSFRFLSPISWAPHL